MSYETHIYTERNTLFYNIAQIKRLGYIMAVHKTIALFLLNTLTNYLINE